MAEEEGRGRAKRRCARNKYVGGAMPSAIHYVGYVEDDETPEMIMAKFAELERIKAAAEAARCAAPAYPPADQGNGQPPTAAQEVAAGDPQLRLAQDQGQAQAKQQSGEEHGARPSDGPPFAAAAAAAAAAVVRAAEGEGDGGLSEAQLLEVFRQTSMFNVRTALQDNAMLLGIDELLEAASERYAADEPLSDDDDMLRAFWSDEDDLLLSGSDDDGEGAGRRGRRRGGARSLRAGGGRAAGAQRGSGCARARHNVITAFNPVTQALVRRKVRAPGGGRDEIQQLRVPPPPLPLAWGRAVAPYVPRHLRGQRDMAVPVPPALLKQMDEGGVDAAALRASVYREERRVWAAEWAGLVPPGGHQAVLVNPGWEVEGARGNAAVQRLAQLPMRRLVPRGFVFVFVAKQHIQALCRQMRSWGYAYIENLTWVFLRPDHSVARLPARYANASHLTLYMFRREGEGKDIELRHQRNPDVTFDCLVDPAASWRRVPDEIFVAVETLLPTGKGKFLELWAPRGVRRPGWTHVAEAGEDGVA